MPRGYHPCFSLAVFDESPLQARVIFDSDHRYKPMPSIWRYRTTSGSAWNSFKTNANGEHFNAAVRNSILWTFERET